ncbi:trans-sulfuration enzyme family protein [Pseudoneobacillus rhizosphaerae]|uniref:homocysteine desulfhydrase n=1 Tax=Pseudoneobacillus rhizosphaerae TaxID=2880968 RepID=A0A9C7G7X8_9BACI|nr:PLP-dependent aspartate aminotransferase family protein [Pseudoneobacillus rhizosphaerae]CAG9607238.1 L-methionine gamma-lyase [Pseudoneobacillus rhizosphaerae]
MSKHFDTEVLHGDKKEKRSIMSKVTPIYQTSAFVFKDLDELEGYYHGNGHYLYSRVANPNTDELAAAVARLEGAVDGVAASSGLSAILAGVLAVVKSGDHIVAADDLYGGSFHMLKEELNDLGIETSFVSFSEIDIVEKTIQPNTKLLFTESITNPLLRVENIKSVVELAKKKNLYTLVDNTFATPYHCKPLTMGIDLVVHSATKYFGGHSDVTAGVLVGRKDLLEKAKTKIVNLGANVSPFEAWLTTRGIKTLALRMEKQSRNAQLLAEAFLKNPLISKTYYPFEMSENGYGAMVTIELDRSLNVNEFFRSLGWVKIVPTLAGVETTVSHPLTTSHRALPSEACEALGITKELVRISVGIEHVEDIISQFTLAIENAKKH